MVAAGDVNGYFILISQLSFLWYVNIIEMFFESSSVISILGLCMALSIVIDIGKMYSVMIRKMPAGMMIQLVFFALMLPWGTLRAINVRTHISTWINSAEYLLVMISITYYALTRKNIRIILWNIFAITIIQCAMFLSNPVDLGGGLGRYSLSAQLNPNGFAIGLTQGLWALLCLISIKRIPKSVGLLCVGIILYSILLTGSRKGLIAASMILIGWFFFSYLSNSSEQTGQSKLLSILPIAFALFILIEILIPFYNDSSISNRMLLLADEASSGSRSKLYATGFKEFLDNILFGYGFGGFKELHGIYSHTTIIEVLVSCGLPMSILYFSSYLVVGKDLMRKQDALRIINGAASDEVFHITRMGIVLLFSLLFYSTCIIHIYEPSSMISLGLLFSSCSYQTLEELPSVSEQKRPSRKSKYIKES